jgi:transcriptional regulator with XRE-family HTH domain
MYFASNIKFLRKRKGRTQDDVASALDLKRSTLSGYENGVAQPGIDVLVSFSGYFNLSIDTLLKIDIAKLSESQLGELERGYDAYVKGSNLRVLTTTVNAGTRENIELVAEKAKAGYATGYADPEFIGELPVFNLPFLSDKRKYRTFR